LFVRKACLCRLLLQICNLSLFFTLSNRRSIESFNFPIRFFCRKPIWKFFVSNNEFLAGAGDVASAQRGERNELGTLDATTSATIVDIDKRHTIAIAFVALAFLGLVAVA
jgi:hypothetical protein